MTKIKNIVKALTTLAGTCANGHKSVITRPDGSRYCMDCQSPC